MNIVSGNQEQAMMKEALRQAARAFEDDEVPVGAVIVHGRSIIARAHNQVERLKDPTAHAEMIAITQAAGTLKAKWLHECTLYATIEPCFMCSGAIVLSRLKRLVFGASDPKAGACGSLANVVQDSRLNHRVEIVGGVLAEECAALMSDFFQRKRKERMAQNN